MPWAWPGPSWTGLHVGDGRGGATTRRGKIRVIILEIGLKSAIIGFISTALQNIFIDIAVLGNKTHGILGSIIVSFGKFVNKYFYKIFLLICHKLTTRIIFHLVSQPQVD